MRHVEGGKMVVRRHEGRQTDWVKDDAKNQEEEKEAEREN